MQTKIKLKYDANINRETEMSNNKQIYTTVTLLMQYQIKVNEAYKANSPSA